MYSVRGTQAAMIKNPRVVSMSSSEHREFWLHAAILSFCIAAAAPMVAQVFTETRSASCLEARLVPLASLGQADGKDLIGNVLALPTNFFIDGGAQTSTGRLTCADPRPAFYNCGHTKQSVWGCKPDCFIEPDGTQYVIQTPGKSYSVIGDPNQIRPFLTDQVTVTGTLKGETIRVVSIAKSSRNVRLSGGMRSEAGTP